MAPLLTPIEAMVDSANQLSDEDFIDTYLKPEVGWTSWTHPHTNDVYEISFHRAGNTSKPDLQACLNLIDLTSGEDYRNSSIGWNASRKLREMKSPDLRYTVVKSKDGQVKGFTSLMPTFEDGYPVVYCYEIHLLPELQRTGLGKKLMDDMMRTAENIPCMEKVMLTCFVSNKNARAFYDKLGFEVDPFSPQPRKLRGGKVVVPDITIMSKPVAR